jgi:hypothetical protein
MTGQNPRPCLSQEKPPVRAYSHLRGRGWEAREPPRPILGTGPDQVHRAEVTVTKEQRGHSPHRSQRS